MAGNWGPGCTGAIKGGTRLAQSPTAGAAPTCVDGGRAGHLRSRSAWGREQAGTGCVWNGMWGEGDMCPPRDSVPEGCLRGMGRDCGSPGRSVGTERRGDTLACCPVLSDRCHRPHPLSFQAGHRHRHRHRCPSSEGASPGIPHLLAPNRGSPGVPEPRLVVSTGFPGSPEGPGPHCGPRLPEGWRAGSGEGAGARGGGEGRIGGQACPGLLARGWNRRDLGCLGGDGAGDTYGTVTEGALAQEGRLGTVAPWLWSPGSPSQGRPPDPIL